MSDGWLGLAEGRWLWASLLVIGLPVLAIVIRGVRGGPLGPGAALREQPPIEGLQETSWDLRWTDLRLATAPVAVVDELLATRTDLGLPPVQRPRATGRSQQVTEVERLVTELESVLELAPIEHTPDRAAHSIELEKTEEYR